MPNSGPGFEPTPAVRRTGRPLRSLALLGLSITAWTSASAREPASFAPGIHIDWPRGRVEIDSRVVLKQGPLELFACTPNTREHESILVIGARPSDVRRALHLLGLTPGRPPGYDQEHARPIPATGDPVRVLVRCPPDSKEEIPAERWMLVDTGQGRSTAPDSLDWVFSGSVPGEGDRLMADQEGTVVAVVDFPWSLVAPATPHTSDNESLWLRANSDAIPERGTACRLILVRGFTLVSILVQSDGRLFADGSPVSTDDLTQRIHSSRTAGTPERVYLRAEAGTSTDVVQSAARRLVKSGLQATDLEIEESPPPGRTSPKGSDPEDPPTRPSTVEPRP